MLKKWRERRRIRAFALAKIANAGQAARLYTHLARYTNDAADWTEARFWTQKLLMLEQEYTRFRLPPL